MKTTTLRTTEMDVETVLAAASAILKDQLIVMVNLLRCKLHAADYSDRADVAPCSGGELTITITPRLSAN